MCIVFFFFKQKTAYEMRISDWSSDVCSSDLASALPFALQLVTGFLVLELGVYLWHRTMHNSEPLWRAMHQMHHSAERVDIWGAFYFHPLDMVGWAFLGSLCLVGVVGLTPDATLIVRIMAEIGRASCRERVCQYG